jgi:folate-binding protein YgfZ
MRGPSVSCALVHWRAARVPLHAGLARHGAGHTHEEATNIGADDNQRMNPIDELDGVCRLDDWGLIRASGPDAASFLHGQLTNDVANLGPTQARLAGYCSPKGRLLASFIIWREASGDVMLACSVDLLPATLKRLRMFVLRSRCVLSDASGELPLYGLVGPRAMAWLGELAPQAPWVKHEREGLTAVALPDAAGFRRVLCASTRAPELPPLAPDVWRWLEVRSGIARIEQATVEQFVPQMLNYELLGGVDFQKGCYPGQEIVARSQYRGSIKRRSVLFETDSACRAGDEVFHSDDAAQPAGMVVNAAPQPSGFAPGSLALVEIKLAALAGGSVHLGRADGPALRRADMPYALPSEATAVD